MSSSGHNRWDLPLLGELQHRRSECRGWQTQTEGGVVYSSTDRMHTGSRKSFSIKGEDTEFGTALAGVVFCKMRW